jgi:dinuclear metal center YbgI/SA1388 family protein
MKLKELTSFLDSAVPISFQESWDNSGLQVGLPDTEISSALVTLDITEEVLDEAGRNGCDVIISHHPLIFQGIKRLSGRSLTESMVMKAVKKDIAVYSAHTSLDMVAGGVSRKMAEKLNLNKISVLSPLKGKLLKLVTFIPETHFEKVRNAVFSAGAGVIGDYDNCSFTGAGTGSFRGNENSNPFTGEKGRIHFENEVRFETILYSHLKGKVVDALIGAHPYEEVAYDLYLLENENSNAGLGCKGELAEPMKEEDFLNFLSTVFGARGIRYSGMTGRLVRKVALCGGAGGALINEAIASGADAFVSADIRYHSFLDSEKKILIADIGHFESEKFASEILYDLIVKNFPKFAVRFSEINTNPINYL